MKIIKKPKINIQQPNGCLWEAVPYFFDNGAKSPKFISNLEITKNPSHRKELARKIIELRKNNFKFYTIHNSNMNSGYCPLTFVKYITDHQYSYFDLTIEEYDSYLDFSGNIIQGSVFWFRIYDHKIQHQIKALQQYSWGKPI